MNETAALCLDYSKLNLNNLFEILPFIIGNYNLLRILLSKRKDFALK